MKKKPMSGYIFLAGLLAVLLYIVLQGKGESDSQVSPVDGMAMVYVPAGKFKMGSNYGDNDEMPVHTVYLDAYWIDKYEVTNAQYKSCVHAGDCNQPEIGHYGNSDYEDYPVTFVSWYDAEGYCTWAGRKLPTEAEWEKIAKREDERTYLWGEGIYGSYENYTLGTPPARSYTDGASSVWVTDMAGNVWEWVADWYDADYYDSSPSKNPEGPSSGDDRVIRGGTSYPNVWVRPASRGRYDPVNIDGDLGFRCALSP